MRVYSINVFTSFCRPVVSERKHWCFVWMLLFFLFCKSIFQILSPRNGLTHMDDWDPLVQSFRVHGNLPLIHSLFIYVSTRLEGDMFFENTKNTQTCPSEHACVAWHPFPANSFLITLSLPASRSASHTHCHPQLGCPVLQM